MFNTLGNFNCQGRRTMSMLNQRNPKRGSCQNKGNDIEEKGVEKHNS